MFEGIKNQRKKQLFKKPTKKRKTPHLKTEKRREDRKRSLQCRDKGNGNKRLGSIHYVLREIQEACGQDKKLKNLRLLRSVEN